jgi:hypothetical protein
MALSWTPHPILKIPEKEEQVAMGAERVLEYYTRREEAIERERDDPFRFGTELPHWKLVDDALTTHGELLLLGGNRSGKTEAISKRVVQSAVGNPNSIIWCFTATSQNSIAHQQASIFRYLPKEYKNLGRSQTHYISYSLKNGFTNSSLILPNRSRIEFRNWSQSIETIEGGEIGCPDDPVDGTFNIGAWFDEEVPLNFIQTCRYRCLTRSDSDGLPARLISSFTTVSGWTNCVSSYLSGAKTIKEEEAELLDGELVPVVQQPVRKNSRVVYFHTRYNPYGGWEAMKAQLSGARRDEILCRAYGIPTKPNNTTFANLTSKVIRKPTDIPVITDPAKNPATWILSIDPAGSKSWFMLLVGVDAHGVHYVTKEWPDISLGEWADIESSDKPKMGDGQKPNGFGISDYAKVVREMLQGISSEEIIGYKDGVEIIVDPRLGSATYSKAEGTSNIIEDLQEHGINAYPAEALPIEDGLQAINTLLSYDKEREIGLDNHSKLIFSEECGNTLFCCMNYVVEAGLKSPLKDPTDCLRYIAVGNYQYYEDADFETTGTGSY